MIPSFRLSLTLFVLAPLGASALETDKVLFNRDIRPILSENCFHCHGPDKSHRKSKLRLDQREDAINPAKSGEPAIIPGNITRSELLLRVASKDEDEIMPPPDSHKKLTPREKDLLKRWIAQGAEYQAPWAFVVPTRSALPKINNAWWSKNAIDPFIAATLENHGLAAAPEAPKELILRRVTFALTGLPPTPTEADAFLADTAPDAYSRVVERLLGTPQFGEQMARYWLDAARYGDTHGMHLDNERSMWPYRDWVARAFNSNLPFDQFTLWQLAGDLLPSPTRDQLIASGFNRCNVTTSESGSINDEVLLRYALDRTETTASTWLALTAGCATCHDHKFDPISQKDFYSLYSFFNSAADPAMDGNDKFTKPVLKLTTPEQDKQLAEFDLKITGAQAAISQELAKISYVDPASLIPPPEIIQREEIWVDDEFPADIKPLAAGHPLTWTTAEEGAPIKSGKRALKRTGEGITQDYFDNAKKPLRVPSTGTIFANVWLDPANPPKAVMLQWHSEGGWKHRANWGDKDIITFGKLGSPEKLQIGELPKLGEWVRLEVNIADLKLKLGTSFDGLAFTQYGGTVYWDHVGVSAEINPATDPEQSQLAWEKLNQGKDLGEKVPQEVRTIFRSVNLKERKPEHEKSLREYFLSEMHLGSRERFDPLQAELKKIQDDRKALDGLIPATLIMAELPQKRPAFVMKRGQYDQPGEAVEPAVPAVLPQLATKERANRIDLAKWLFLPEQPLTARVMTNRLWQQFFGTGLVKTSGDFGAQGEPPSHPELLDWLAVEFRETGWDIKAMVRLMVTSATYRQDSQTTANLLEKDPENRLLAHGPRFRLDAEEVRDNVLMASGLIDLTIGGPPVKPYQPENIWEPVGFVGSNTREYKQDHGSALYRRSLYTFWKRNAPAPFLTTFDAPSRESGCVRRERSDTPLQALLLMNDVQHFEAARALGQRMLTEGGITPEDRLAFGFRLVTTRHPLPNERNILKETFEKEFAKFAANPATAQQAISVGESKPNAKLNPSELAAYTMIANLLFNMDETLTKN